MKRFYSRLMKHTWIISSILLLSILMAWNHPVFAQQQSSEQLEELSQAFRQVAQDVGPSVVFVSTVRTIEGVQNPLGELFGEEFFRRFFGTPEEPREFQRRGLGSGFIVDKEGYILTNNHVVEDADEIEVNLPDGQTFEAKIVGTDPKSDVAVIKIEGDDFPVAPLSDTPVEVGDWVLAIGNPYGLAETMTAGIISAEGRANIGIVDYEDFIQTDAAINPGNSGGPLVNIYGEVVGINTAIFSRSGGYQGIGFAIPMTMAKTIMTSLIETGKVIRGWLGVMIQPVNEDIAQSFGLEEAKGALIGDVVEDSPADNAELQRGDIVVEFDGQQIKTPTMLKNIVAQTEVGKTVPVVVIRDGERQTIEVEIGEQPSEQQQAQRQEEEAPASSELGLNVQELTPDIASQLGYTGEQGVIVSNVAPATPAAEAGLRRGDLIKEVNRNPITSVDEYEEQISSVEEGESILMLVQRGDSTQFVVLKPEEQ